MALFHSLWWLSALVFLNSDFTSVYFFFLVKSVVFIIGILQPQQLMFLEEKYAIIFTLFLLNLFWYSNNVKCINKNVLRSPCHHHHHYTSYSHYHPLTRKLVIIVWYISFHIFFSGIFSFKEEKLLAVQIVSHSRSGGFLA